MLEGQILQSTSAVDRQPGPLSKSKSACRWFHAFMRVKPSRGLIERCQAGNCITLLTCRSRDCLLHLLLLILQPLQDTTNEAQGLASPYTATEPQVKPNFATVQVGAHRPQTQPGEQALTCGALKEADSPLVDCLVHTVHEGHLNVVGSIREGRKIISCEERGLFYELN